MADVIPVLQGFSTNTSEGMLAYCSVSLVRGEHLTLVDVGYPARQALLVERLRGLGIGRTDIDRVVLTHAHWDHSLNLLAFPNAEVVISRDEYDYAANPHPDDWATPRYVPDIFARCAHVTTVNDGEELEPGVRTLAVPGHSPGSLAVLVDGPEGTVGLVGDALPSRAAAAARVPSARLVFYDEAAAVRSARRILDTCRFVHPGHDRPFRIEAGSFHYLAPAAISLVNPPRDEDGTVRAAVDPAEVPFEVVVQPSARRREGDGPR